MTNDTNTEDGFLVINMFNPFGYIGFYLTIEEADSVAKAPDPNGMTQTRFVVSATRHRDPAGLR